MAGVDLTWEMLGSLDEAAAAVFILGGTQAELEGTQRRIEAAFPRLRLLGARNGYFDPSGRQNDEMVVAINAARPDVLLVAMGFPRQEQWIAANVQRLEVRVVVAEGGSFSFLSGVTARAPRWLRRMGLEWLFRLLRQPWRLRRQLALPQFVWLVVRERLRKARAQPR